MSIHYTAWGAETSQKAMTRNTTTPPKERRAVAPGRSPPEEERVTAVFSGEFATAEGDDIDIVRKRKHQVKIEFAAIQGGAAAIALLSAESEEALPEELRRLADRLEAGE